MVSILNLLDFFKNDFNLVGKTLGLTVKATTKVDEKTTKGIEMNVDFNNDKEKGVAMSHNLTLKGTKECGTGKFKLEGGNVTFEKELNPSEWKHDDWLVGLKFVGKSVPKDRQFNWTSELRFGLPKLANDVGVFGSGAVTCGSDKKLTTAGTFIVQLLQ